MEAKTKENRKPKRVVYFDTKDCDECEYQNDYFECSDCLESASYELYYAMKKAYSKANKVFVVAHCSNWRGQTGFKVLDLTESILKELISLSEYMRIYREGRKFYAFAASHDVPMGATWELILRCYNGPLNNKELTKKWMKEYN